MRENNVLVFLSGSGNFFFLFFFFYWCSSVVAPCYHDSDHYCSVRGRHWRVLFSAHDQRGGKSGPGSAGSSRAAVAGQVLHSMGRILCVVALGSSVLPAIPRVVAMAHFFGCELFLGEFCDLVSRIDLSGHCNACAGDRNVELESDTVVCFALQVGHASAVCFLLPLRHHHWRASHLDCARVWLDQHWKSVAARDFGSLDHDGGIEWDVWPVLWHLLRAHSHHDDLPHDARRCCESKRAQKSW
jgi:hypothetical protein